MFYTIAVILLVLWALGLVTGTAGGLIHLLLAFAIVMVLAILLFGRKRA